MDALKADGAKAPAAQTQVDTTSAAVLMYTSGTTGNPKGVLISHKAPPRTPTLTLTVLISHKAPPRTPTLALTVLISHKARSNLLGFPA